MSWRVVFQFQQLSLIISKTLPISLKITKMPYYAVAKGRTAGIYMSWGDCESQVKGFSGARYKKFDSVAMAEDFIKQGGNSAALKAKPTAYTYAGPSNNNLKRPYSSSSNSQNKDDYYQNQSTKNYSGGSRKSTFRDDEYSDEASDESDDLSTVVLKQIDDIEKRVNKFGKGLDKIMNKSSKSSSRKTILIEPSQPKKRRSNNMEFSQDRDGYVEVYTDGACSANGQKGARAGLGVYWGEGHSLNTSEPVSGRATNNCGEIQAATCAIKKALQNGVTKLAINTDSQFLIKSVTQWMPGWKRKGWKLASGEPVKNEKDFKELDSLQNQLQIKWNYVEAHRGVHGNEMADQLAKEGAAMYKK